MHEYRCGVHKHSSMPNAGERGGGSFARKTFGFFVFVFFFMFLGGGKVVIVAIPFGFGFF